MPSFGATNSQITRLLQQKKQKMAQLEQCAQKVKGFKIAGISTLGLTAVGVGGNIALASKNKSMERDIDATRTKLDEEQKELDSINAKIDAEHTRQRQAECEKRRNEGYVWQNGSCELKTKSMDMVEDNTTEEKSQPKSGTDVKTDKMPVGSVSVLPSVEIVSEKEIANGIKKVGKESEKATKDQEKKNKECKKNHGDNYWWNGKECVEGQYWDSSVEIGKMPVGSVSVLPSVEIVSEKEIANGIKKVGKESDKAAKQIAKAENITKELAKESQNNIVSSGVYNGVNYGMSRQKTDGMIVGLDDAKKTYEEQRELDWLDSENKKSAISDLLDVDIASDYVAPVINTNIEVEETDVAEPLPAHYGRMLGRSCTRQDIVETNANFIKGYSASASDTISAIYYPTNNYGLECWDGSETVYCLCAATNCKTKKLEDDNGLSICVQN